jgi:CheY-like chemotaxis protein
LLIEWKESGVLNVIAPTSRGFGTTLIERSLEASGGEAIIGYNGDGLACRMRIPLGGNSPMLAPVPPLRSEFPPGGARPTAAADFDGKRILVIEDEPLLAIDLCEQLKSTGCEVIGPAHTVEAAKRLIAEGRFDAVLLDANLGGHAVDDLAASLAAVGLPFAFATGYGREALPQGFQDALVLTKPFDRVELLATLGSLLAEGSGGADVVRLELLR